MESFVTHLSKVSKERIIIIFLFFTYVRFRRIYNCKIQMNLQKLLYPLIQYLLHQKSEYQHQKTFVDIILDYLQHSRNPLIVCLNQYLIPKSSKRLLTDCITKCFITRFFFTFLFTCLSIFNFRQLSTYFL